jgi:hypothetical protein
MVHRRTLLHHHHPSLHRDGFLKERVLQHKKEEKFQRKGLAVEGFLFFNKLKKIVSL